LEVVLLLVAPVELVDVAGRSPAAPAELGTPALLSSIRLIAKTMG
jgi:hypothetical protein